MRQLLDKIKMYKIFTIQSNHLNESLIFFVILHSIIIYEICKLYCGIVLILQYK